jgi:hypothetical protein
MKDDLFPDLSEQLSKLDKSYGEVVDYFNKNNIGDESQRDDPKFLSQLLRLSDLNTDTRGLPNYIEEFVKASYGLAGLSSKYSSNYVAAWEKEKAKGVDLRKAERKDMWISWIQKTIRWGLGIIFAVLLYSTIAWVSEKNEFVKIPIKDWLPKSIDTNK